MDGGRPEAPQAHPLKNIPERTPARANCPTVGGFLIRLSPVLAVAFPNRDATVGDLARDVVAVNHARLVDEVGSWNKKDVWEALCRVIVIQTGVAHEKITPGAGIFDDLRID
jgi:hypothetical protein